MAAHFVLVIPTATLSLTSLGGSEIDPVQAGFLFGYGFNPPKGLL
jgi:hypothetical protein